MTESENQFYAPYWEWEDYQCGMYNSTNGGDLKNGEVMFTNPNICYDAMKAAVDQWVVAAKVNLTNKNQNRRAWIGQAASCVYANLTQEETCEIWRTLEDTQRKEANRIADRVIQEWEAENERFTQTRIFGY